MDINPGGVARVGEGRIFGRLRGKKHPSTSSGTKKSKVKRKRNIEQGMMILEGLNRMSE